VVGVELTGITVVDGEASSTWREAARPSSALRARGALRTMNPVGTDSAAARAAARMVIAIRGRIGPPFRPRGKTPTNAAVLPNPTRVYRRTGLVLENQVERSAWRICRERAAHMPRSVRVLLKN
jgi:hypothetical protein